MQSNISPAFEQFMAESGPNDKKDAIILFESSVIHKGQTRGSLRSEKRRNVNKNATARKSFNKPGECHFCLVDGLRDAPVRMLLENTAIRSDAFPVSSVEVTKKSLLELAKQPGVRAIMPNQRIHLIEPKAVYYNEITRPEAKDKMTWGLKALDIPRMWETTRGAEVNVAVLDTGVYGAHPALNGRVKDFIIIDPLGNRIKAEPSFDSGRHGTHVCGTIGGGKTDDGISIGVAPEVNLLVATVLMSGMTLLSLIEGINWAVDCGANVISMSLGFSYYEPKFSEVFDILINQYGIVPVVAIGNENHGNTSSPGNAYNALAVGAVKKIEASKTDVAFFSSGASLVFPGHASHPLVHKPDVVAPGVHVFSSIPPEKTANGEFIKYTYMDGTSMAAPHVAGVAALLMAAKPQAHAKEIMDALVNTARHPDGLKYRPDNRWGNGLIQPMKALKALD